MERFGGARKGKKVRRIKQITEKEICIPALIISISNIPMNRCISFVTLYKQKPSLLRMILVGETIAVERQLEHMPLAPSLPSGRGGGIS
jgi:hypothetical protein